MKSIKELETEIYNAESCDEVDTQPFVVRTKFKIEALKDVLGLIDELKKQVELIRPHDMNGFDRAIVLNLIDKELKKRINGT